MKTIRFYSVMALTAALIMMVLPACKGGGKKAADKTAGTKAEEVTVSEVKTFTVKDITFKMESQ